MTFSTILAAVDGSAESINAAERAIQIAAQSKGSEVIALHVIEVPTYAYYHAAGITQEIIDKGRIEADNWFREIAKSAEESQVKLRTDSVVCTHPPYSKIIEYAEQVGADLVVVGTTGKTGLKRLLLGSVASNVVTYAPCTVMVVRGENKSNKK